MPIFIWIKSVKIRTLFNFTDKNDPLINYWFERANIYAFFTLFFLPIIPLRCKKSVRVDKNGNMYERKVTDGWKFLNQMFWILWIFIWFMLFGVIVAELW